MATSWVIRNKSTGEVVMETWEQAHVEALDTQKYEAIPILDYLGEVNRRHSAELVELGQDDVTSGMRAFLIARGWQPDSILKNTLSKEYSPNTAVVRLRYDPDNDMRFMESQYISEGHNVLVGTTAYLKSGCGPREIQDAMQKFLDQAENKIEASFARRFLSEAPAGPAPVRKWCEDCKCTHA